MSEPETEIERPYTGPPLGDPRAKKIGEFTALLSEQSPEFQDAIASLRADLRSHQPGYAPMPFFVELVMNNGTRIVSQSNASTNGVIPATGVYRLVLSNWNHDQLEWCIVDIDGDGLSVIVHRNPTDRQNDWRPISPTIIPPPAATTAADPSTNDNARSPISDD